MRYTTASTARAARLLLLILVVIGLQPVSAGQAEPTSPTHVSPAALLAGPPVPLPVSGIEQQGGDGDGRAPSSVNDRLAGEDTGRDTAASACTAGVCPWCASDALDRAGRRCSPSTAPPASPV